MNRRQFLKGMAFAAAAIPVAPSHSATVDRSRIGANTALPGYGLLEAMGALRKLGFEAIEMHPFGTPEAAPGVFPGFQFDTLPSKDRDKIRAALASFRQTTHLPFQELHFFSVRAHLRVLGTPAAHRDEATAFLPQQSHVTPPSWPEVRRCVACYRRYEWATSP